MSKKQLEVIISDALTRQSGKNQDDILAWIKEKRRHDSHQSQRFPLPKEVSYSHFEGDNFQAAIVRNGSVDHKRVIVYLHGGAFVSGGAMISRNHVSRISKAANISVLNVDYRLAPEFSFPDALEDALAAYRWLLKLNYSNKDIAFVGGSAGGHLALSTLLFLKQNHEPLPAAVALMSPWINLAGTTGKSIQKNASKDIFVDISKMKSLFDLYRGKTEAENPLLNPLKCDLTGLPPMFIQVGENEVFLDDAVSFSSLAKRFCVPVRLEVWPDMIHGFQIFEKLDEGQEAINQVGEWIKSIFLKDVRS